RMERWNGKVAIVTGASAGIGAAIAQNLVKQGMIVAGFARRVEKIKEIADCLKDSSDKLHAVECDVTKEESVAVAFAWVKDNLGPISVLVNSAGITKESSLIDGTLEDWRSVFDVNVLGLCLCTREAVRMMREMADEDAIVIHVNSLTAERVPFVPGFSVYPASKRAITGLAMTLRHELAGTRIRVTVRHFINETTNLFNYIISVICRHIMNTLTNKIAFVTGACSGIDKAVTKKLVSEGLKTIDINLLDLSIKKILEIDNGWIINVNDVCGLKLLPLASDRPLFPAYAASKSALIALSECLRLELAQNEPNIKVTNLCPGLVETELNQQWLKENSRLALKPKDVADAILYSLQTPENVLIKDFIITPIREIN
ncbi:Dehydrogenase/reductase SDR family member 11, partial [Trachymyrmex cornetzi]